jgi:hypothetical protein
MLRIQIHIKESDPDPYQSEKHDPDPYQSEKHDPDPFQSEKNYPDLYKMVWIHNTDPEKL